jgi:hypothetical protein
MNTPTYFLRLFCVATTLLLVGIAAVASPPNIELNTDFSSLPGGSAVRGLAYISGGVLHLEDAGGATGIGSWVFTPSQPLNALRVKADMFIGGGSGADGISFSYGDLGAAEFGETGAGSGLRVNFRTYVGIPPAVEIWYGPSLLLSTPVDPLTIRLNAFVPFEIIVQPSGACVVKYNNTTYFSATIPGWNPQAGWLAGFGGRTAGLDDNHWIDNLSIRNSEPYLVSLTRTGAQNVSPIATTMSYRAVFSEPVTGVGTGDFVLNTVSGSPLANIGSISGPAYQATEAFNSAGIGSLLGSAAIVAGQLHLTEALNSQTGTWYYTPGQALTAFRASFDLLIGNGDGADGFAFVYGATANTAFREEGPAGELGLIVSFDIYPNAGETGIPNITVRYNGVDRHVVSKTLRTGNFVPVLISVSSEGLCSVSHAGSTILNDIVLPGWNPQATWHIGLGAGTGGLNDQHYVDNLVVENASYDVNLINLGGAGEVRLDMAGASIADLQNINVEPANSNGTNTYIFDFVPPAPVISGATTLTNASRTFTVNFGEAVTGFDISDVTVANGTRSNMQNTGPGVYTFDVLGTGTATVSVSIAAGRCGDSFGNSNLASNVVTYPFDGTKPTPVITGSTTLTNATRSLTINFGEAVSGFDLGDISVNNGAASNLQNTGTGTYTVDVLGAGAVTVSVSIPAAAATDTAGNTSNATAAAFTYPFDDLKPTPVVNGASSLTNSARTLTVDFGETVTGFGLGAITVANGSASNLQDTGSGTYTFSVLGSGDVTVSISIVAAAATDAAGNTSNATAAAFTYPFDDVQPLPALSGVTTLTNTARTVTIDFGEAVSNFVLGDITVSNGSVSNLQNAGTGTYTVSVLGTGTSTVSVSIAGGVCVDTAGNSNGPSAAALSWSFDGVVPTSPTISPARNSLLLSVPPISVTFSENVTGVAAGNLTVAGSPATAVSGSGAGPYQFSGFAVPPDGNVAVVLASGSIADAAGNGFAGDTWNYVKSSTRPGVALFSGQVNQGTIVKGTSFTFTAQFTESASGLLASEITVANATVSNFVNNTPLYTFTLTPSADGPVSVQIPENVAQGIASPSGRLNTASVLFTFTSDNTVPVITINGGANVAIDCGDTYADLGASAVDTIDGDVSDDLVVSGDAISGVVTPGVYQTTYTVTDTAGNTAARTRTVTVADNCPLAAIAISATDPVVQSGDTVTFEVMATGAIGSVNYQWLKDNTSKALVPLTGETDSVLIIAPALPFDSGEYVCEVSDDVTTVQSPVFTLTILGGLPLAGLGGLVALSAAIAAAAAGSLRRKK